VLDESVGRLNDLQRPPGRAELFSPAHILPQY
jgi:hypothetical protein